MGAWTTRIFDDDGASDILAEYKILLGYGVAPEETYEKIKEYFYPDYEGQDDEDVYWLSIALYQWQNGILMDEVKEKALQCIESESYLERWKDSGEKVYNKRRDVLQTLKDKLLHEVNPRKKKFPKCPKYYREKTPWKVGDLLAYRCMSEPFVLSEGNPNRDNVNKMLVVIWQKYVLLRVVDVITRPVTRIMPELDYASCAKMMLYDWMGDEIPDDDITEKLEFRSIVSGYDKYRQVWKLVNGLALQWDDKEMKEECEIICIGNDPLIAENKPDLYLKNKKFPLEFPSDFNFDLARTLALPKDANVEWMYKK